MADPSKHRSRLILAGDLMLGGPLFERAFASGDDWLGPVLSRQLHSAEVVLANLEFCITERALDKSVVFDFRLLPHRVAQLRKANLTAVSIANNHALDAGLAGLEDTCRALESVQIQPVGVEPWHAGPLGMISAFVRTGPTSEPNTVSPDDPEATGVFLERVALLHQPFKLVILHFLGDFLPEGPPASIRSFARKCARAGASLVVLQGAHHILGLEWVGPTPILHGLGSFIDDFGVNVPNLHTYRGLHPDQFPAWVQLPDGNAESAPFRHPELRNDLGLLAEIALEGRHLRSLSLLPIRIDRLRVELAQGDDLRWVHQRFQALSPGSQIDEREGRLDVHLGPSGFTQVDANQDPAWFGAYLQRVFELEGVQNYKREGLEALLLHPGQVVLDVGCGAGLDLPDLVRRVGDLGRVIGVDPSEALLSVAPRHPQIEYVRGEAEHLPFSDESVDVVRCERLLVHVESPADVVAEMARVLKSGGQMAMFEPVLSTLRIVGSGLATEVIRNRLQDGLRHPDIGRKLAALAEHSGLKVVTQRPVALSIRQFSQANRVLNLGVNLWGAAMARQIRLEDALEALSHLEALDRNQQFLAEVHGHGIIAIKPHV